MRAARSSVLALLLGSTACGAAPPVTDAHAAGAAHARDTLHLDARDEQTSDTTIARSTCAALGLPDCTEGEHQADDIGSAYTIARATFTPRDAAGTAPFIARVLSFHMESFGGGGPRGTQALVQWLVLHDDRGDIALRVRADEASLVTELDDAEPTRMEWLDAIPGDAPELVLDVSGGGGDHNLCGSQSTSDRTLVICAADPLRCTVLNLAHETTDETYPDCDEGTGDRVEVTRSGYRVEARIDGGAIAFTSVGGVPPSSMLGRRMLSDLFDAAQMVTWRP